MRPIQTFQRAIASASSFTDVIDAGTQSYSNLHVYVPVLSTAAAATDWILHGSDDNVTYAAVKFPIAAAVSAPANIQISSAATNAWHRIEGCHFRYLKIKKTDTADSTAGTFRVVIS
jgi:hypothetical protein